MFSYAAPAKGQYASPGSSSYKKLSIGSKGTAVSDLQLRLITLGYLNSSECTLGSFDASTEAAMIRVQQAMGFTYTDGAAAPEIQAFLASPASKAIQR